MSNIVMKNKQFSLVAVLLALCFAFSSVIGADGGEVLRDRMKDRLPAIDQLKKERVAGENNQGFLEVRTEESLERAQRELIEAENRDRLEVYRLIAAQAEATPEVVGQARARQIAERSARGIWLQNEKGDWYLKP